MSSENPAPAADERRSLPSWEAISARTSSRWVSSRYRVRGPEEPSQAIALGSRDDMGMEVGDRLAHNVVHSHERSLGPGRDSHCSGDSGHGGEIRSDELIGHVLDRRNMEARDHERVARKERGVVEKGSHPLRLAHNRSRGASSCDVTECAHHRASDWHHGDTAWLPDQRRVNRESSIVRGSDRANG